MQPTDTTKPARSFWVMGALALIWNAIGIVTFLMTVTMSPEALADLPEAERALYTDTPAWSIGMYAIAVFGGTLAAIVLLLRKAWAVPLFAISLVAIIVQMGYALFMTPLLEVRGATAAIMPLVIVAVAVYLLWYARTAREKGWLG